MPHPRQVFLFLPLLLLGPVALVLAAVLELSSHGPFGIAAAIALVLVSAVAARAGFRWSRRWWAGTKAPARHT